LRSAPGLVQKVPPEPGRLNHDSHSLRLNLWKTSASLVLPGRQVYRDPMRWELLFADLEALADATERAGFDADVADRSRSERAGLRLADRLRAHVDGHATITIRLTDGTSVTAGLLDVGADWVLLEDAGQLVVPLGAVVGVEGLTRSADGDPCALARRLGLTVVLRRLARDRATVRVRTTDRSAAVGTIDRVGADHLDLALHPQDEFRRTQTVRAVRVIPLAAVVQVRAGNSG
jgi:hypothetical protein